MRLQWGVAKMGWSGVGWDLEYGKVWDGMAAGRDVGRVQG